MSDYPRRILLVGNGARENALGNALLLSPRLERLCITPANLGLLDPQSLAGRSSRCHCANVNLNDNAGITALAQAERSDLVVIGPEAPLVAGLADTLRAARIPCVGPGQSAARLEGSKRFAKDFMQRHGIPSAQYREFSDPAQLLDFAQDCRLPVVLKADGLAAGKGVYVCHSREAVVAAAQALVVDGVHGSAAETVIAEDYMSGPEISFVCLLAGGRAEVLPPSSDYKRLRDGDEGPNTGGMGNICPSPYCSDETLVEFVRDILAPTVRGLAADGLDYRGFLFVGTMLTDQGLRVLEYNVRCGDPEAEVILPLCAADWPAVLGAVARGELPGADSSLKAVGQHGPLRLRSGACVAVMLASAGYPDSKAAPSPISGLERVWAQGLLTPQVLPDGGGWEPAAVQICFAGVTAAEAETGPPLPAGPFGSGTTLLASGGRVLCISARAADLSLARRLAYEVAGNLHFDGMQLRSDIGKLR